MKSLYFITPGEALRRVQPEQFADIMIEQEWTQETRRLTEILDAMDLLFIRSGTTGIKIYRQKIEQGKIKMVEKEIFPDKNHPHRPIQRNVCQRDIWEGA